MKQQAWFNRREGSPHDVTIPENVKSWMLKGTYIRVTMEKVARAVMTTSWMGKRARKVKCQAMNSLTDYCIL